MCDLENSVKSCTSLPLCGNCRYFTINAEFRVDSDFSDGHCSSEKVQNGTCSTDTCPYYEYNHTTLGD